jgi:hypothetical protein
VIVALELLVMDPVVTAKVPEVAAAATVTDAGTVRVELVFDNATLAPPLGAGWVKLTVQVLEELDPRLVGLHDSEEIWVEGVRLMLVLAVLPL